jgi:hypothetical protein
MVLLKWVTFSQHYFFPKVDMNNQGRVAGSPRKNPVMNYHSVSLHHADPVSSAGEPNNACGFFDA